MKVNIIPCRLPCRPGHWPLLLKEGIERVGDTVEITRRMNDADLHVFWGLRRQHGKTALRAGKRCLVVERAYLGDRMKWRGMGFDGLNGLAEFPTDGVSSERWNRLWRDQVKPWKDGGEYALIMGQCPGDAALYGKDPYQWANEIIPKAREVFGDVYFRHHPSAAKNKVSCDVLKGDLGHALDKARVVITYSSNSAVDAVMAGTPAISMHEGSMAWDVTTHDLDSPLYRGDRDEWGRKLAYSQWHPAELKIGEAWKHLREYV